MTDLAIRAERDQTMAELAQSLLAPVKTDLASDDVAASLARTAGQFYRQTSPEATNGETAGFIASIQPALNETTADSDSTTVSTWLATAITNGATLLSAADGSALTWVTMQDEDVRDGHRHVHGQVRRLGQPFAVMGQELHYPGEPVGPPEVWMNCRCALHAGRQALSIQPVTMAAEPAPARAANLVLVAIPAPEDPIYAASSEQVPHVTLVFLGDAETDLGAVHQAVLNAAEQMPSAISLPVASRETLGADEADVAFLDGAAMQPARDAMLADPYVKDAYESIKQFPTWKPHLTLGYPDTPAKGDPGDSITFDRLAVWDGDYSGKEYAMGTKPADPAPVDEDEEFALDTEPDLAPPEPADDEDYTGTRPLTWHGVLAQEGVWSGDRRRFADNAMTWRDLPLPLSWQKATADGHDGSVVVGAIETIEREGNLLRATGTWNSTPEADEVIGLMADGSVRGVSVDVDSAEMTIDDEESDRPGMTLTAGRISGATICAIPAFAEAFVSLGDSPDVGTDGDVFRDVSTKERKGLASEGKALPDGSFPIANLDDLRNAIQAIGRAKDPDKAKAHIKSRAKALGHPELIPDSWALIVADGGIPDSMIPTGPGDKRGPGWVTDPAATRRIHAYWTHPDQPGFKIGWGAPGDFNRCRAQLAKYLGPKFLNRTCAEWHHDALGIWPGEHAADIKASSGDCSECGPALSIVAAASEEVLPFAWFMSPGLDGPTPLQSDGDHIWGHLALWNSCHIGHKGVCVSPPHSMTNYAHFRTGSVLTEAGRVPVGQITMDTGHADLSLRAAATKRHYDDTGTAMADIAVGEDTYGIWLNGALRSTVDAAARRALFAAALSGDWRGIGGSLEMVGALAVNIPGFAVPQVSLAAAGDEQISLVAAGALEPPQKHHENGAQELATAIVDEMIARDRRALRARTTMNAARTLRVAKVKETV